MNGEQIRFLGAAALARLVHARDASGVGIDRYGCRVRLRRWSAVLVGGISAAMLIACGSSGSSDRSPVDDTTRATSAISVGLVRPEGFGTASLRIRRADGSLCEVCTYVARTLDEKRRGLMGVTDLGGFDGMTFVFDPPVVSNFWMRDTVVPLTGVWFDATGGFLGAFDMQPCPDDQQSCPFYNVGVPAATVVEFALGDAGRLGIGEGAVLEAVGGPCTPAATPRTTG